LLLQSANLPTQRRLRDPQGRGSAAEVPVVGHHDEVPHQPQVEVDRREVVHVCMVIADPAAK
jgi:hypothetical protein